MTYSKTEFQKALTEHRDWLSRELASIRTGRAAPSILDVVRVESYGSMAELGHVAAVSIEDPKTIRVSPWDTSMVKAIEKAITEADLGVSLASDGKGLRVIFPELTTERRQLFVKSAKERLEQARIAVRQERQKAIDDAQSARKAGEIGEDDEKRQKDEIQKAVDEANAALEALFQKKEAEILE
jgi:ribosome recycling factor